MSKRLLLADDSITIQKVIQITFAHEDYELTITDNGDSAFARARELVPDLVLADVYMPGKNGYELCSAIKQEPVLRHIPVLLLAGSFEPFDEGKAREAGANAWIEKPFESQALIDKVASLLSAAPQPAAAAVVAAAPAVAIVPAEPVAPVFIEPPAPAAIEPFGDISFEEPAVPVAPVADTADDWSDLNEQAALPPVEPEPSAFAFAEPPVAVPAFEFAAEPFPPAVEPLAFEPSTAPGTGIDVFGEAEEVMALGDDDILGAEDLEPAGEMPTLSPWSREELAPAESFEAFAVPEPFATPPVIEPLPPVPTPVELPRVVAPPVDLTPVAVPAPSLAAPAPVAVPSAPPAIPPSPALAPAVVEQRVATLTESEIEQIVERAVGKVIERLAGTVLERIAWEVVPDLAEALIKDEIRKIKDAAA